MWWACLLFRARWANFDNYIKKNSKLLMGSPLRIGLMEETNPTLIATIKLQILMSLTKTAKDQEPLTSKKTTVLSPQWRV
jgi:hypothetical protein